MPFTGHIMALALTLLPARQVTRYMMVEMKYSRFVSNILWQNSLVYLGITA